VIGRGFNSFTKLSENRLTFCLQSSCDSIHAVNCSLNAGRSRKRCFVFWKTGGAPSIRERGSIRSAGSSWLPQLSHWSPRALSNPQIGHVPSM
jgi:hypothetical protein